MEIKNDITTIELNNDEKKKLKSILLLFMGEFQNKDNWSFASILYDKLHGDK